jgi:hypothetical protein
VITAEQNLPGTERGRGKGWGRGHGGEITQTMHAHMSNEQKKEMSNCSFGIVRGKR